MKRLLTMLFVLLILNTTAIALAEVEVEDAANMPPPMVIVYDQPAVSEVVVSAPVITAPTIFHTVKETTTMPPSTRTPVPVATPAESSYIRRSLAQFLQFASSHSLILLSWFVAMERLNLNIRREIILVQTLLIFCM